jgi:hypothetical protein
VGVVVLKLGARHDEVFALAKLLPVLGCLG